MVRQQQSVFKVCTISPCDDKVIYYTAGRTESALVGRGMREEGEAGRTVITEKSLKN
jgi:hypothetical protein